MAENKNATFDGIMRDLRARKYAPVYYLMGDEPYYIDKITDYIAENVLRPEERDFNQTVMFGSDVSIGQVVDAAKRYPMMADRQVVIVKEAQNLRNTEPLEYYLQKPLASTVLVMCHKNGTIDRRKKLAAMVERTGVLFESKKMRERDLPPFISSIYSALLIIAASSCSESLSRSNLVISLSSILYDFTLPLISATCASVSLVTILS